MIAGLALQRSGRVTMIVLAAALLAAAAIGWGRRGKVGAATVTVCVGEETMPAIAATVKEDQPCTAGARHSRALMYLLR